jgi:uncharacterized protein YndB with AHSA1/START domain
MDTASSVERVIRGQVIVPAPLPEVWQAWATVEGAKSFFAPRCRIELRPGGAYEILFVPDAEPGSRGGEGNVVLAVQPERMLSFTWNAPPSLPQVRDQRTHVVIRFSEAKGGVTRVTLRHDGWGDGGEWDQAFQYFTRAWNDVVLPRLVHRFEHGPIDWNDPS